MALTRQQKMLLLFVSLENPLWKQLISVDRLNHSQIAETVGISASAPGHWERGTNIEVSTATGIFDAARREAGRVKDSGSQDKIIERINRFQEFYFNGTAGAHDAANILGMSLDECQKIIDEVIYKNSGIFKSLFFENSNSGRLSADEAFQANKGVYNVYMRRGKKWLICSLRVRYLLKTKQGLLIRCKLNLPAIDGELEQGHWEYDGFLSPRANNFFWMFESREHTRGDYLYFATCKGRSFEGSLAFSGTYLTTGQDDLRKVVSDEVIFQRIATTDDQLAMRRTMQRTPGEISDAAECEKLQKLLDRFRS